MNGNNNRGKKKAIFSRDSAWNQEVFEVPTVRSSWATICPAGSAILAEEVTVSWCQTITRFYEIGSNRICYVGGPIRGRWGAERIISPRVIGAQFLKTFCAEEQDPPALDCREIRTETLGEPTDGQTWSLEGVEISAIGLQVHAEMFAVQGDVAGLFTGFGS